MRRRVGWATATVAAAGALAATAAPGALGQSAGPVTTGTETVATTTATAPVVTPTATTATTTTPAPATTAEAAPTPPPEATSAAPAPAPAAPAVVATRPTVPSAGWRAPHASSRPTADHHHHAAHHGADASAQHHAATPVAPAGSATASGGVGLAGPADPLLGSVLGTSASLPVAGVLLDGFRIPPFLLPIYQAAGIQYGIRWEVLAAINEIETDFGRNLNRSSAGAEGWMQFMPATWARYGVDANGDGRRDPDNPVDAIFAAARYLRAAGGDGDLRKAVFAYNHAGWYVDSVLLRARLFSALPDGVVDALTGLVLGRFPVHAAARFSDRPGRRSAALTAARGSAVIAVQDGKVLGWGHSARLGRFVRLRDVYGNTYTYGHLAPVGAAHHGHAHAAAAPVARATILPAGLRWDGQRLPGGAATQAPAAADDSYAPALPLPHRRARHRLRVGTSVAQGTLVGRTTGRPLLFEVRPSGAHAARVDPRPLLSSWRLLEHAQHGDGRSRSAKAKAETHATASVQLAAGQALLMTKSALQPRVLGDHGVHLYACGRQDIRRGRIDRRVLATLEYLRASGLHPTVSALRCGHGRLTSSGNVSEHSTGDAVDISKINGTPILGHQGPGSITDVTIRRLLTLQGAMKPHQIISLMTFRGADNTLALPDHADHIHVGFRVEGAAQATLGPRQWRRLVNRLATLPNPQDG